MMQTSITSVTKISVKTVFTLVLYLVLAKSFTYHTNSKYSVYPEIYVWCFFTSVFGAFSFLFLAN